MTNLTIVAAGDEEGGCRGISPEMVKKGGSGWRGRRGRRGSSGGTRWRPQRRGGGGGGWGWVGVRLGLGCLR